MFKDVYVCDRCDEKTIIETMSKGVVYKNKKCEHCPDGFLHKVIEETKADINMPAISYTYGKEKLAQQIHDRVNLQRDKIKRIRGIK